MRLPVLLVLALGLAGCKGQCRQLSERLCECAVNTNEKNACLGRAASAEGSNGSNFEQEAYCQSLLKPPPDGCNCRLIDTTEGKIKCGLARDPARTGGGDGGS